MNGNTNNWGRSRTLRMIVTTQESYGGFQRKIAWFNYRRNGLYFDVGGFLLGTHTSYHRDGNIFRTSPSTANKSRFQGRHVKLDNFRGWYQLGVTMIAKERVEKHPSLKASDRKKAARIIELVMDDYPSETINIVIEMISPDFKQFLNQPELATPTEATTEVLEFGNFSIILTVLGHDSNLLVRADKDNFYVSHFNSRFSANQEGVNYSWEAYG
jgi:hypothetical protein